MPVEVKLLPRKLRFFCDPSVREQMLQAAAQQELVAEGQGSPDSPGSHQGT